MNKRESFDITKYSIQFMCIFDPEFKDILISFQNFLKTEFNTEPLDCVLEINKLLDLKSDKEIILKSNEIIDTFLKNSSKREVNISGDSKNRLFTNFQGQLTEERWILEETAYDIFFPVKKILMNELHADNFPRFIRTKNCLDVVSKYNGNPKVMILCSILKYPLCDKDFEKPFISQIEMNFIKDVFKDSFVWELVTSTEVMNTYTCNIPLIPNSEFFKRSTPIKIECVLPFSFEKVANFFFSIEKTKKVNEGVIEMNLNEKHWTKDLKVKYPNEDIRNPFYFISGESFGKVDQFPFNTPRRSNDIYNIEYDAEEKRLSYIRRPYLVKYSGQTIDWQKMIKFERFPTREGKDLYNIEGYVMNVMDMLDLQIIDENTTRISFVTSISIFLNSSS
jgi:hypothetical protein